MATHVVNTHEAKSQLSQLIRAAEAGEEVIVARNGQPVARIVPWGADRPVRTPGAWASHADFGEEVVASDPDVLAHFEELGE